MHGLIPQTETLLDRFLGVPVRVLGLIVLALIVRWLVNRTIDGVVKRAELGILPDRISQMGVGLRIDSAQAVSVERQSRRVQRARTMGSLLKSVTTSIIFAVVITMILAVLNINIAPIIAGAGIVGVAVGFGAQSLVKDFLSGIFMIFEDQYGVGDSVDLGEASGTIEAVSLRVTRLRDVNGTVWYVRNGEIARVGNMSQNWARTVLDVPVDYTSDVAKVRRVLAEVAHDVWADDDFKGVVIEEPEVWGIQDMTPEGLTMRVTLKTAPMQQWAVAREMRARIKSRFDHEGIRTPVQRRIMVRTPESEEGVE